MPGSENSIFKLPEGFEHEADKVSLTKEDLLHWILLGCYLSQQGDNGMITLPYPALALQKKLMLPTYESVVLALQKFADFHVTDRVTSTVTNSVTDERILTIKSKNWRKSQGDSSKLRTRKWRSQNAQKSAQNLVTSSLPSLATSTKISAWFDKTWGAYPKERRVGKKAALRSYRKDVKTLDDAKAIARALETYLQGETVKNGYIRNASTFFSNWRDYEDDNRRSDAGLDHAASLRRPDNGSEKPGEQVVSPDAVLQRLADSKRFPA